jgi:hypothetical protein
LDGKSRQSAHYIDIYLGRRKLLLLPLFHRNLSPTQDRLFHWNLSSFHTNSCS